MDDSITPASCFGLSSTVVAGSFFSSRQLSVDVLLPKIDHDDDCDASFALPFDCETTCSALPSPSSFAGGLFPKIDHDDDDDRVSSDRGDDAVSACGNIIPDSITPASCSGFPSSTAVVGSLFSSERQSFVDVLLPKIDLDDD